MANDTILKKFKIKFEGENQNVIKEIHKQDLPIRTIYQVDWIIDQLMLICPEYLHYGNSIEARYIENMIKTIEPFLIQFEILNEKENIEHSLASIRKIEDVLLQEFMENNKIVLIYPTNKMYVLDYVGLYPLPLFYINGQRVQKICINTPFNQEVQLVIAKYGSPIKKLFIQYLKQNVDVPAQETTHASEIIITDLKEELLKAEKEAINNQSVDFYFTEQNALALQNSIEASKDMFEICRTKNYTTKKLVFIDKERR